MNGFTICFVKKWMILSLVSSSKLVYFKGKKKKGGRGVTKEAEKEQTGETKRKKENIEKEGWRRKEIGTKQQKEGRKKKK